MAFNGSGTHNRIHDWTTDKTNLVAVTASRMDAEHDDISTALSSCLVKDGQQTTTARIPFTLGVSSMSGTVSSASYGHISDANTGVYFPAADEVALSAGGTQALTAVAAGVTVPGTLTGTGAASFGSTLGVTGNVAVNTDKFNITAASGNTTVAGTLAVTGAQTFTGNTTASGNLAVTGTSTLTGNTTVGGTLGAGNTTVTGTMSVSGVATLSSVTGGAIATQAEQEAAATSGKIVVPGNQHWHPSAAKVWGLATVSAGTPTLQAGSFNVTSITDSATGLLTVTIATDFSAASKATMFVEVESDTSVVRAACVQNTGRTAGSMVLQCSSFGEVNNDPAAWQFVGFGDL